MALHTQPSLTPDDALSAILALAQREMSTRRLEFRAHDSQLQDLFRDIVANSELLRSVFVFSTSGPKPYSPDLNDAIAKLQLAGLLGRQNPDYQVIFLRPSAEKYFEVELEPHLTPAMKKE